jgi:hypothetical protein
MKIKLVLISAMAVTLAMSTFALAAKTTCATIQGGTLTDVTGNPIGLGYDQWGYNYQAHMFNGFYDNYARPSTPVTSGDSLMMKWNDAWLSNMDCNGDTKLDRPANYIGSGAWLTNHANGNYIDVAGTYVINVEYLSVDYPETLILTQSGTSIIGTSLGGGPYPLFTIIGGSVSGNNIEIDMKLGGLNTNLYGTIAADGTMSGTWEDVAPTGSRTGTWTTTSGNAETCYWSDFVKIVAVPTTAVALPDASACPALYGLDGTMWHAADGTEIGCSIWSSFAIIQDVYSDPCGLKQFDQPYHSAFNVGLGIWKNLQ